MITNNKSENSAPASAKKIKIGNVELSFDFDAEAVYRFSSVKGSYIDLQAAAAGTEEGKASAFAEVVNLAWAMLSGEDRLRFSRPEKMAHLFLPYPSAEVVKQLVQVFMAGSDAIGFKAE